MKNKILIFIALLFLLSLFVFRHHFSIFYFQNDLYQTILNVETKKDVGEIFACVNQNCKKLKNEKNIYSFRLNQQNPLFYEGETKSLEIALKDSEIEQIKTISLFEGFNLKYFDSEIKNFSKNQITLENKKLTSLVIPVQSNNKNILQKIGPMSK